MNNFFREFVNHILSFNRISKRIIVILFDIFLCIICTWIAFYLRLEEFILFRNFNYNSAFIAVIIAIPTYWMFGSYRVIFRYTGFSNIYSILIATLIYGLIYFIVIGVYGLNGVPRSIGIIQPILMLLTITSSRLIVKYFFLNHFYLKNINKKKENVMIYGAGEAGRQLFLSLENNTKFEVVGFLDDDIGLKGQILLGKKIYSLDKLNTLLHDKQVSSVFLAMPSIERKKRNKIIQELSQFKLIVKTLPSISEIINTKITSSDIQDLNIEDLLNRDQVKPDNELLKKNISFKTVIVTGAGGSIGSELCRQILKLKPKKLLLLELNEFSLYKIYEELISYSKDFKIIPLLVNLQDQKKLEKILETFKVDTIYHAAAYKHVPLVEENISEGVKNNVFSTLAVARSSIKKKVSSFVFISSDKAVRPTNIMGASKRLAEICIQGIQADKQNEDTNFSIVRFGNVLESSGSVIPKFKKQIKSGGPVTLTHQDVTRFFMTITEAAQLVIQAGAMSKNSEVFILDMGKSVKIIDLITKMVKLSGLMIKNDINPYGDIEIKIIGLRPGEKLYEELMIGDNIQKTNHPKIFKAKDQAIPFDELNSELDNLKTLIDNNDVIEVKKLLQKLIKLYSSNYEIVDHIYLENNNTNKLKKKIINNSFINKKIVKIK